MDHREVTNELLTWKKEDLCFLIETLMKQKKVDITDINLCHIRALESQISEKDKIIFDADNLIFNSIFTDSLGKPADSNAMMDKLRWLDDRGMHNMDGIMEYLRKDCKQRFELDDKDKGE